MQTRVPKGGNRPSFPMSLFSNGTLSENDKATTLSGFQITVDVSNLATHLFNLWRPRSLKHTILTPQAYLYAFQRTMKGRWSVCAF